jgi:hypothetical protein
MVGAGRGVRAVTRVVGEALDGRHRFEPAMPAVAAMEDTVAAVTVREE